MGDNINNKICLYADEANLVINKSSIENFSILNFSKTNIIQFHTNHSRNVSSLLITMADKVIQEVGSTTFLGLTIDQLTTLFGMHMLINFPKKVILAFST